MDTAGTLQKMTQNFQTKIDKGYTLTVQLDIQDESVSWHCGKKRESHSGQRFLYQPHLILTTTTDTLQKIYRGGMTAFTAVSKAK